VGNLTRFIGIVSGKGGVGKTTVAINLGTALSHHFRKNVTIVDCNLTNSHLGLYLGMYYSPVTLNNVLKGEANIEDAIYKHFSGVNVVPAALSVTDLKDLDLVDLGDKIRSLSDKNDIVFLDVSPGIGREALATLKACDEVLYVTNPYVPCIMDVIRNNEIATEYGVKPLGIVVNMVHNEKHEMNVKEIEHLTRLPVICSIPFDKNVNKSLAQNTPVIFLKPRTKASISFKKLAAFLVKENYKESFLEKIRSSLSK
jgi:septum site-determining protein MinD